MRPSLTRFAWLSIAAALLTISIKFTSYWATGSVGLLSDALEGLINLSAALVVLVTLRIVDQPPDECHPYGHDKAEYFSSGIESILIIVASVAILATGVQRLLTPQPLERISLGLILALIAASVNLIVGRLLIRTGKQHDSITLEADGQHLMSDVWTSVAVVLGVAAAGLTGLAWLDPVIAILVGLKIGWEGIQIFRRTSQGLMDSAIAAAESQLVKNVLNHYCRQDLEWHALRTRQSGSRRFVSVHILVPGTWTIQEGHDLAESIETEIRRQITRCTVFTHIEPVEDPRAFADHPPADGDRQPELISMNGSFPTD